MSTSAFGPKGISFINQPDITEKRGLFLVLSVLLLIAGCLAIWLAVYSTLLTVSLLGMFLFVGGIVILGHATVSRAWLGFLMNLLVGILYFGLGLVLMVNPAIGAVSLTMLIASFFVASGLLRISVAIAIRFEHWAWFLISGLLTFALGLMIWQGWPVSGLFMIGTLVGIELIASGAALLALVVSPHRARHLTQ